MMHRGFWIMLVGLVLSACSLPLDWLAVNRENRAQLDVEIQYQGGFYTDIFGYAPDAPNIRHVVLVMPEMLAPQTRGSAWIFTSIVPDAEGALTIAEDKPEYAWALDYLYDAPGGMFSGMFKPGRYAVAAAFLAGPVTREESGAGEDVLLWAGITGGGASTEYQIVELETGKTTAILFPMTDANGWACPWLYVFDGDGYQRYSEILRNQRGETNNRGETTPMYDVHVLDGAIRLRIVEEKAEITYLDALYLLVNGQPVYTADSRLGVADGDMAVLHQGDSLDLYFPVGDLPADASVSVVAAGYYDSLEE